MIAQPETTTQYRVVHKETFWLIDVSGSGPYAIAQAWIPPLWESFIRRTNELPLTLDRSAYVCPTHGCETEFTYYIGFASAEELTELPTGMLCIQILAHTYVVGRVLGPQSAINTAYASLIAWIGEQGHELLDQILWLDVFPEPPNTSPSATLDYEIYLPIRVGAERETHG
jgi:predicted transcriptional regulator YdeE